MNRRFMTTATLALLLTAPLGALPPIPTSGAEGRGAGIEKEAARQSSKPAVARRARAHGAQVELQITFPDGNPFGAGIPALRVVCLEGTGPSRESTHAVSASGQVRLKLARGRSYGLYWAGDPAAEPFHTLRIERTGFVRQAVTVPFRPPVAPAPAPVQLQPPVPQPAAPPALPPVAPSPEVRPDFMQERQEGGNKSNFPEERPPIPTSGGEGYKPGAATVTP